MTHPTHRTPRMSQQCPGWCTVAHPAPQAGQQAVVHERDIATFTNPADGSITVDVEMSQWQPIDGERAQLQVLAYRQDDHALAGLSLDAENATALAQILAALAPEDILRFAAALNRAASLTA
jgi:hypothetical protein